MSQVEFRSTVPDSTTDADPPQAPPCAPPPRHRMAVLVWLAIYPTITLLLALSGSAIAGWPLPLRTLALTLIAVPLMVFVLLPRLQQTFSPWLAR
jgi:antibiotic biosynthesis monooxygenase (ABM) superfamily enzyme